MELSKILLAATLLYGETPPDPIDDFVCVRQAEDGSYVAEFETSSPLYITLNGETVYTESGHMLHPELEVTGHFSYAGTANVIEDMIASDDAYIAHNRGLLDGEPGEVDQVLLGEFLINQALLSAQRGEYVQAQEAIEDSIDRGFAVPECVHNGMV